jgi:hypothetical protein
MPSMLQSNPTRLWKFFQDQIEEIRIDQVLRFYGVANAAMVLVAILHFLATEVDQFLQPAAEAICWPMLEACGQWRLLSADQWRMTLWVFALLAVVNISMFLKKSLVGYAYLLLAVLIALVYVIVFFDYRLRLNQHIMAWWIHIVFLFVPNKKAALKIIIPCFYFWAGVLKLNADWISGSTLYEKPWLLSGSALSAACVYVILLELLLVWGLLKDKSRIAWLVLGQLALFHLFSFKIVGFYYPILMFLMLSIFPLSWLLDAPRNDQWIKSLRVVSAATLALLVFNASQLWSKTLPGDTALTGEGRLFSLHMFDALVECFAYAEVRGKSGKVVPIQLIIPLAPRIRCDPAVFLSRARLICQSGSSDPKFQDLRLLVVSKRSKLAKYQRVVDLDDFCRNQQPYKLWAHNSWLFNGRYRH